jgi:hypothetical protein
MKRATRKYAAYQVKWIRKRLLPAVNAVKATDPTLVYSYVLDTSGMPYPCPHPAEIEPTLKMQITGRGYGIQL